MIYRIGLELRKPLLVYAHPDHNSLASVREAISDLGINLNASNRF